MLVTPIASPGEYDKRYALETTPETLVLYAKDRNMPETLSFMPNIDVEHTSVQGTELCTHIMYANLRKIFRLPTLGAIDQKQKYSSIYASARNMRPFFNGSGLKMVNFRIVAEVMLLYGLTIKDIQLMTESCCSFDLEPDGSVVLGPNIEALANLYSKKQVANTIKAIPGITDLNFLPNYITRGMEYISYEDFLHTFRSIGQDPYQVLQMFAFRDTDGLSQISVGNTRPEEFTIIPIEDLADKSVAAQGADTAPQPKVSLPAEPAPDMDTAEDDLDEEEKPVRVTFGSIITKALEPFTKKMGLHVLKNIYILRENSYDNHKNMQDRDFDDLFVASNPTNLDILNRLVRISHLYSVSMYDLLFTELPLGKYKPTGQMWPITYSLEYIAEHVDKMAVTNENLFKVLACLPPKRMNVFGYMPPVSASDKAKGNQPLPTKQPEPSAEELDVEPANPITEGPEMKGRETNMNIELKLRICSPCDTDSWENDNPDRSTPGFHWENGSQDICDQTKAALRDRFAESALRPNDIRACINGIVNLPFKAQVTVLEQGSRMVIDIF